MSFLSKIFSFSLGGKLGRALKAFDKAIATIDTILDAADAAGELLDRKEEKSETKLKNKAERADDKYRKAMAKAEEKAAKRSSKLADQREDLADVVARATQSKAVLGMVTGDVKLPVVDPVDAETIPAVLYERERPLCDSFPAKAVPSDAGDLVFNCPPTVANLGLVQELNPTDPVNAKLWGDESSTATTGSYDGGFTHDSSSSVDTAIGGTD